MAQHNETGNNGEQIALDYLVEKNYIILEKNWRHKKDELDLITRFNNKLVIVEVKTRSTNYFGEPESFVDKQKQQRMIVASGAYIELYNIEIDLQFDIISILIRGKNIEINHIEDAFSILG